MTMELTPLWGRALRARVGTAFACTVTPRDDGSPWLVTDCLPERRGPGTASMMLNVSDELMAERGAPATIVIHPAFLDDELVAGGARLLGRMVPMWLALDDDLLRMHARPFPCAYRLEPFTADPDALAVLSPEPDVEGDRRVWREVRSGEYGPLIEGACFQITGEGALCAAIAVTEYQGTPLVAHVVTAAGQRGKGLGRAILIVALQGLCAAGYVDCRLHVVEENRVARRLYRSLGFVQHRPTLRVSYLGRERVPDAT